MVKNFDRRTWARNARFSGAQRNSSESWSEKIPDGFNILRRLQQPLTPLREHRGNLASILFSDKIVARLSLQKQSIERPGRSVVRV
jgi:hypothetical protein